MLVNAREYTKLSIHNHFGGKKADCKLDAKIGFSPVFVLEDGYSKLQDAKDNGFTLLVQTNSNNLDAAAYLLMRSRAKQLGVELLPGAELNLLNWADNKRVLHTIVVFSPQSNVFEIQEEMRGDFRENNRFVMTIDQLCELLYKRRALLCFHGVKQKTKKRSISENGEMAQEAFSLAHFFPVAFEDNKAYQAITLREKLKKYVTEGQYEWLETQAASLSTADRCDFSNISSPTYIWAGNTFDDLYYCVLAGAKRIVREEDMVERVSYISEIRIDSGKGMLSSRVSCSQGLNCIVGTSGSGKTLLLDIICNKLGAGHLERSSSSTGTYEQLYDTSQVHLFGPHGNEVGPTDEFEIIEGSNLYDRVIKAYSSDRTELVSDFGVDVDPKAYGDMIRKFSEEASRYLSSIAEAQKQGNLASTHLSQVKSALKFLAANEMERPDVITYNRDPKVEKEVTRLSNQSVQLDEDMNEARSHFAELKKVATRSGLSQELIGRVQRVRDQFLGELAAKKAETVLKLQRMAVVQAQQTLLFDVCQEYNGLISARFQQVNEKKQVVRDKFEELASALLSQQRCKLAVQPPVLSASKIRESIVSRNTNEAARLMVDNVNVLVDKDSLHERFPNAISQRPARGKVPKGVFDDCYDLSDIASVKSLLDGIARNGGPVDITLDLPLEASVSYSIELKAENGQFRPIETFSAGELSKVYVLYFLEKAISDAGSNAIILYDQPESNMEKEFLLKTLAKKLDQLRKSHQIFIATHEPLLVVNADANELILATNDKRVGQGNQVRYINRSFVGIHKKSEAVKDVAKLIDGGTTAVRHRSDVYEGMINSEN